jgi:hypothetical protein
MVSGIAVGWPVQAHAAMPQQTQHIERCAERCAEGQRYELRLSITNQTPDALQILLTQLEQPQASSTPNNQLSLQTFEHFLNAPNAFTHLSLQVPPSQQKTYSHSVRGPPSFLRA